MNDNSWNPMQPFDLSQGTQAFDLSQRTQPLDLSQGTQDVNAFGRGSRAKQDHTRRSWSPCEEEILMFTMKDLVARGWKSDNGFRQGYLSRCEDALKREDPNSDVKATPHVVSKLTQWKRSYNALVNILGRSGVGFNLKNDYKIDCDNEQWAQIVKQDNNARFMRFKSWPMWEDWKFIFGKDRANGDGSEDSFDSYNVYNVPNQVGSGVGETDFSADPVYHSKTTHSKTTHSKTTPSPQQDPLNTPDESSGQSMHASQQSKKNGKKRKAANDSIGLIETLKQMQEDTNLRLDKLTSRIGFEFDVSKLRKEVVAIVEAIPGLTLLQQIDVAEIILDKVERIELFMCLSKESRPTYVMRALEKYG